MAYQEGDRLSFFLRERFWDVETAERRLVASFPDNENQVLVRQADKIVKVGLSDRWQLGFEPIRRNHPAGGVDVHCPSFTELARNNRYRHSLEVANMGVELAQHLAVSPQEQLLLAVGLLLHDYKHTFLSHMSDRFLDEVNSWAVVNNPRLSQELSKRNLVDSHEGRLFQASRHDSQFAKFLGNFTPNQQQRLSEIWAEQGLLGAIASLVDTAAYLRLDSAFFGQPPRSYLEMLKKALLIQELEPGKRVLRIEGSSSRKFDEMFTYRDHLFDSQYASPVNRVLEAMQLSMLLQYALTAAGGERHLAIARNIDGLTHLSDREIVQLMRRRALLVQTPRALGFFGIIPQNFDIKSLPGEEEEQGQLFVKNTYYEKRAGEDQVWKRGGQRQSNEDSGDFWIKFSADCFWRELRPVLEVLCANKAVALSKLKIFSPLIIKMVGW